MFLDLKVCEKLRKCAKKEKGLCKKTVNWKLKIFTIGGGVKQILKDFYISVPKISKEEKKERISQCHLFKPYRWQSGTKVCTTKNQVHTHTDTLSHTHSLSHTHTLSLSHAQCERGTQLPPSPRIFRKCSIKKNLI